MQAWTLAHFPYKYEQASTLALKKPIIPGSIIFGSRKLFGILRMAGAAVNPEPLTHIR